MNNHNTSADGWGIVNQSIRISRPARELYDIWRNLESLPRILTHVKSVRELTDSRSHWVVEGPLGTDVEWDSVITQDVSGKLISWRSVEDAEVDNEGTVEFTADPGSDSTLMDVRIAYRPPAGALGKTVAALFGKNPDTQVRDDLAHFKEAVETDRFARSVP